MTRSSSWQWLVSSTIVPLIVLCSELMLNSYLQERYIESIRDKAVYLPDTMDYLARANGYSSAREVQDAALGSAQLVVAVGFYFVSSNVASRIS